ncbi:MAG: PfkB family carbohydrate kinase [Thiohalomonadales bacterium]
MSRFLGVGIATLDVINTTAEFPDEDQEVRAVSQRLCRGGNVCNTLSVLSQLGNASTWCGTLADDNAALVISDDLRRHNIDFSNSRTIEGGHTPTSYITLNQQSGSRTIVHYRKLPELDFGTFKQLDLAQFSCCHFEGRNVEETRKMILHVRHLYPAMIISVEIEKPRADIEQLFSAADILFFSQGFAQSRNFASADLFLSHASLGAWRQDTLLVCTWGDQGAWLIGNEIALPHHQSAINQGVAVDTLGAGDTFIAGFLHRWLLDNNAPQALEFACELAAKKCRQIGLEGLTQ